VPPPGSGTKKWQRTLVRDCTFDDVYASHTVEELKALAFSPRSTGSSTQQGSTASGGTNVGKRGLCAYRSPLGDGRYRKGKQIRKRPKAEWIPVPAPASGVRLKTLVQVRRLLDGASQVLRCSEMRFWELSGHPALPKLRTRARRGLRVEGLTRKDGTRKRHFHYACATRRQRGKEACSYARTPYARTRTPTR
jgi:hypothetical protein